jgi:putative redox protein
MPGEMMLTSLAGCSGVDVVGILRKQRQEVTGIDVRVTGVQEPDPPWTWEEIRLEYVVTGRGISAAAVERAIHLSETKFCSVGATLGGRATISSTFRIVEA